MLGGRRHLPLVAVTVCSAFVLILAQATAAFADATVDIAEGSVSDINSWVFTPPEITVSAGESITWKNSGALAHTATAAGGQFDTGNIDAGQSKSVTLSSPGTFPYTCTPHP